MSIAWATVAAVAILVLAAIGLITIIVNIVALLKPSWHADVTKAEAERLEAARREAIRRGDKLYKKHNP